MTIEDSFAVRAADPGPCATPVLRLPRGGLRHWHLRLVAGLRAAGAAPRVAWTEAEPPPAGMETLFALERLLQPRPGPRPSEGTTPGAAELPEDDGTGSVRIALPGAAEAGAAAWTILFDGRPGEAGLLQALLRGGAPLVEVVGGGAVLAAGRPSVEAAANLCEAYEAVTARLTPILAAALLRPTPSAPAAPRPDRGRPLAAHALRRLGRMLARRLYHLCFYAPHWRTGWRFSRGATVWDSAELGGEPWRVLPDPGHRFYADPFLFHWQGRTHLFVEDLDHRTGKGVISAVAFGPEGPRGAPEPVLEEPFHLSYPFVFAHDGAVWMIPETSQNRTVSLYRADPYPHRWVRVRDLLTDLVASDATPIRFAGRWWMFATLHDGAGAHSDMLGLFLADDLVGPWRPHRANPPLIDAGAARPAGAMMVRDGRLWRPVQDCTRLYGGALGLAEVTMLTETAFAQTVRARIAPGPAWPGRRLHTLNAAAGIEVIDGSAAPLRLFHRP
ncbi:glucosamine inositolphosphorylceramide transferase family protein [Methylobacterium radiodurans]|uniref:Formyl transferase n=1 Tax=Methylobacterium radiodurans TaxID=2202828 RepID=A0A2U8VRZ2_9HYPH|nr:formyl transferase [Methylobacterium radiodurans]AWN36549.1 formyl transferase [Methylobacterium radiodurans]